MKTQIRKMFIRQRNCTYGIVNSCLSNGAVVDVRYECGAPEWTKDAAKASTGHAQIEPTVDELCISPVSSL